MKYWICLVMMWLLPLHGIQAEELHPQQRASQALGETSRPFLGVEIVPVVVQPGGDHYELGAALEDLHLEPPCDEGGVHAGKAEVDDPEGP